MTRELTIATAVPGCTLSISHQNHNPSVDAFSVSVYCRVASAKSYKTVQIAYASTSALKLRKAPDSPPVLWTTAHGVIHAGFEITDDAAAAIADFAGIALPEKQEAA